MAVQGENMLDEKQLDDDDNLRAEWVTEYLGHIFDSEALGEVPPALVEDITRHMHAMDIGGKWTPEFIGDVVVKMSIIWSVGRNRRQHEIIEDIKAGGSNG